MIKLGWARFLETNISISAYFGELILFGKSKETETIKNTLKITITNKRPHKDVPPV